MWRSFKYWLARLLHEWSLKLAPPEFEKIAAAEFIESPAHLQAVMDRVLKSARTPQPSQDTINTLLSMGELLSDQPAMKAKKWDVQVRYVVPEGKDMGTMASLEAMCVKTAGRRADYSGSGFGERDIGWYCASEEDARAMAERFAAIGMSATVRVIT